MKFIFIRKIYWEKFFVRFTPGKECLRVCFGKIRKKRKVS